MGLAQIPGATPRTVHRGAPEDIIVDTCVAHRGLQVIVVEDSRNAMGRVQPTASLHLEASRKPVHVPLVDGPRRQREVESDEVYPGDAFEVSASRLEQLTLVLQRAI